jgi:hypothetical protein
MQRGCYAQMCQPDRYSFQTIRCNRRNTRAFAIQWRRSLIPAATMIVSATALAAAPTMRPPSRSYRLFRRQLRRCSGFVYQPPAMNPSRAPADIAGHRTREFCNSFKHNTTPYLASADLIGLATRFSHDAFQLVLTRPPAAQPNAKRPRFSLETASLNLIRRRRAPPNLRRPKPGRGLRLRYDAS